MTLDKDSSHQYLIEETSLCNIRVITKIKNKQMKTSETNKQTKTKMIKMQNCGAYSPTGYVYKTVSTPKAQRTLKRGTRWILSIPRGFGSLLWNCVSGNVRVKTHKVSPTDLPNLNYIRQKKKKSRQTKMDGGKPRRLNVHKELQE